MGPESAFLLVAGPNLGSVKHAMAFLDRLESGGVPLSGLIVNRVHLWPGGGPAPPRIPLDGHEDEARRALAEALADRLPTGVSRERAATAAMEAVASYASMVQRDADATASLHDAASARGLFQRSIPESPGDVHDLASLAWIADQLFDEEAA